MGWGKQGFGLSALPLLFLGCSEQGPREYKEIHIEGQNAPSAMSQSDALNNSPVDVQITWTMPAGWVPKDSASGVRKGSFWIPDPSLQNMGEMDPHAVDVSVTAFAGTAGGLERNVQRWMGQIGLKMDPATLEEFLTKSERIQTRSGQTGIIINFTEQLSGDMMQNKTIYGVIIQNDAYTAFVKAMGARDRVQKALPDLKAFIISLQLNTGDSQGLQP